MFKKGKVFKTAAVVTSLVMAMGILAGCGDKKPAASKMDPGVTDKTIKIGAIAALSGPAAAVGVPVKKGFEAYIKNVNEKGGVNGRQIEIVFENDEFNPANAIAKSKKLVEQDKIFAMSPVLGTPGVLAIMDYLAEKKIPLVYPMTGAYQPSIPTKPYVFAVQPTYLQEAKVVVRYAKDKLAAKKIAVLWLNNEIGKQGLEGVKAELANQKDMQLVYEGSHEVKDVDFSTHIVKAKEAGAEMVFLASTVAQACNILKEAKKQGFDSKYVTSYVNSDLNALTKLAGDAAEGLIVPGWATLSAPNDPKFNEFVQTYQKYNPGEVPSGYVTAGFIAGEVLVEALKRCGNDLTRENLKTQLETFKQFTALMARNVSYSKDNHSGVDSVYFLKVEKGNFTHLEGGKSYPLN